MLLASSCRSVFLKRAFYKSYYTIIGISRALRLFFSLSLFVLCCLDSLSFAILALVRSLL